MLSNYLRVFCISLFLTACNSETIVVLDDTDTSTPDPIQAIGVDDIASTLNGEAILIDILDNDTFDSTSDVTIEIITPPSDGMATWNGEQISYQPSSALGIDAFKYKISYGTQSAIAKVEIKNYQSVSLQGQILEPELFGSKVFVNLSEESFETQATSNGSYLLEIKSYLPNEIVILQSEQLSPKTNKKIQLSKWLGEFSAFVIDQNSNLTSSQYSGIQLANFNQNQNVQQSSTFTVNLSFLSTAHYSLLTKENEGQSELSMQRVSELELSMDSSLMIDVAAAYKTLLLNELNKLFDAISSLQELVENWSLTYSLLTTISTNEMLNEQFEQEKDSIVDNGSQELAAIPQKLLLIQPAQNAPINMAYKTGYLIEQLSNNRCRISLLSQTATGSCSLNQGVIEFYNEQEFKKESHEELPLIQDPARKSRYFADYKSLLKDSDGSLSSVTQRNHFQNINQNDWAKFIDDNGVFETDEIARFTRLQSVSIHPIQINTKSLSAKVTYEYQTKIAFSLGGLTVKEGVFTYQESEVLKGLELHDDADISFTVGMLQGKTWITPISDGESFNNVIIHFYEDNEAEISQSLTNKYTPIASWDKVHWEINNKGLLDVAADARNLSGKIQLISKWKDGYLAYITSSHNKGGLVSFIMPFDDNLAKNFKQPGQDYWDWNRLDNSVWLSSFSLSNPDNYSFGEFSPFNSFGWIFGRYGHQAYLPYYGATKLWGRKNDRPLFQKTQYAEGNYSLPIFNDFNFFNPNYLYLLTHNYYPSNDNCWVTSFAEIIDEHECWGPDNNRARMWQPVKVTDDYIYVYEFAQYNLAATNKNESSFEDVIDISPRLNYYKRFDYQLNNNSELAQLSNANQTYQNPYLNDSDLDNDGVTNQLDDDIDGDGILNADEPTYAYNPYEYWDTDSDGIGNNTDSDDDNDGMPDSFEEYFGLSPTYSADKNRDLDGDGISNFSEFLLGTEPNRYNPLATASLLAMSDSYTENGCIYSHTGLNCWGFADESPYTTLILPPSITVQPSQLVSAGGRNYCALVSDEITCWGIEENKVNQVPSGLFDIKFVAASWDIACAAYDKSKVKCWGEREGEPASTWTDFQLTDEVTSLNVFQYEVCVTTKDNKLTCSSYDNYSNGTQKASVVLPSLNQVELFSGKLAEGQGGCYQDNDGLFCFNYDSINGVEDLTYISNSLENEKIQKGDFSEMVCSLRNQKLTCTYLDLDNPSENRYYTFNQQVLDFYIPPYSEEVCFVTSDITEPLRCAKPFK